jgi:hypothetical protein
VVIVLLWNIILLVTVIRPSKVDVNDVLINLG